MMIDPIDESRITKYQVNRWDRPVDRKYTTT